MLPISTEVSIKKFYLTETVWNLYSTTVSNFIVVLEENKLFCWVLCNSTYIDIKKNILIYSFRRLEIGNSYEFKYFPVHLGLQDFITYVFKKLYNVIYKFR